MQVFPRAVIDSSALRDNLAVARRHAPDSKVWAVIKANAYGHGMPWAAEALDSADGFAVARVEEGVRLREAGIRAPLLVLEGAVFAEELQAAVEHRLELSLHQPGQVALLEQSHLPAPLRVWIKVDTGMHRLGFDPQEVPVLLARLERSPAIDGLPALMTHLANADDVRDGLTAMQCDRMRTLDPAGRHTLSIGNSAGILAFPAARTHWVRPGIMLYGSSPLTGRTASELGLRPVMTLETRLIAVRYLRRGDAIGYGGTYVCPQDMPVGVAAIGYGDGYPRHAPAGTPVLVGDTRAALVGRVSMDMINIDLRSVPSAAVGDRVTLWGAGLSVDEVAERAGTISYELLCHVTARVRTDRRETLNPDPANPDAAAW